LAWNALPLHIPNIVDPLSPF